MISGIITAVGGFFKFLNSMIRRRERQDAERAGALKQRAANDAETIKSQREQLDTAVNKRNSDSWDKMKDRSF